MRSRVVVEMRGLSRRASDTVITHTFAAAATSRNPTRALAWGNERGIGVLLRQPGPLGFGREIEAQTVAVERRVGPAGNVDQIALAQHRSRIVRHGEIRESG